MLIGVLASGRGSNLQALIEAVESGKIPAKIGAVVSDKEDAAALQRARDHGIAAYYFPPAGYSTREEYDSALADFLEEKKIDLVCLAGFMRIVSRPMVERFKDRIINIHPALLPAFPGLHAQKQALDYGVKVSGCTVHFVDVGMDTGPIIAQRAVFVKEGDTEETLSARILEQEHLLYPEAVRLIVEGRVKVVGRKVKIK